MNCPVCQHANAADARFCSNCGTQLAHACPVCSTSYEPGARFCSQCGASLAGDAAPAEVVDDLARYVPDELLRKIRAARAGQTMQGERRTVTMLFADIQGSTAAAEHLDPEEWAEIVNGAFAHLIAPVYRYEGTLARLQGDAILAFFGAPIAHEDDPVRAVRAGLDIVHELEPYRELVVARSGVSIGVRVGINTGLVVVGEVGSDLRVEYTALGDAINVAARMEQTAEPGTVQVTDDTHRLVGADFETVLVGPVEVKGKSEPVLAHRILGLSTDRHTDATDAQPLVGRDGELTQLQDMVARLHDGIGGVCTLTGEAGIGKSRLLAALQASVAEGAHVAHDATTQVADLTWLHGMARSYERQVPQAVIAEMMRRWWPVSERDRCFDVILDAVEGTTGGRDADMAALLATLVDAPVPDDQAELLAALTAPLLHQRVSDAMASYLAAEAVRRPVVAVLDDLHWADAASLALVERLMAVTEAAPFCLVLLMRPSRDEPSWRLVEVAARDHAHRHTAIALEALGGDAIDGLLAALLDGRDVDPELRADIVDRANGNPLFVEEIVRALDEQQQAPGPRLPGGSRVVVPASLSSLLTARLDGLDDATRHVAQVASVIGREFDLSTLASLVDRADDLDDRLHDLLRRGILAEQRRVPATVYAFRHALIQESAYATVLLRVRRELHARIARHLAQHDPDAVHEIARHHLEAGEGSRAFPFLVAAGTRATRAMALRDAITYFTTALEAPLEDADPDLVLAAHDGLGEAYGLIPDLSRASVAYQSLLDYGRASGKPTVQVTALNRLGFSTATLSGDLDQAMHYLTDARRLAEEVGDELGLAEYHMNACMVSVYRGDFDQALSHDAETARLGTAIGNVGIRLAGLERKTLNLLNTMRFDEARQAQEESVEVATSAGDDEVLAVMQGDVAAVFALLDGDVTRAMEQVRPHLATLDRLASINAPPAHHRLASCGLLAGDVELALAEYGTMERMGDALAVPFYVAPAIAGRAHVLALCGLTDDLAALRRQATSVLEDPIGGFLATTVWLDLAAAALAAGAAEGAQQALDEAVASWGVTRLWEGPRIHFGLTRVALLAGDLSAARTHLDDAAHLVTRHRMRFHEPEQFVLDGALAAAERRLDDAVMLLTEGEQAATESGRRLLRVEALGRFAAVRAMTGNPGEATVLRERADALARELAASIMDDTLRSSFLDRMLATTTVLAAPAS